MLMTATAPTQRDIPVLAHARPHNAEMLVAAVVGALRGGGFVAAGILRVCVLAVRIRILVALQRLSWEILRG